MRMWRWLFPKGNEIEPSASGIVLEAYRWTPRAQFRSFQQPLDCRFAGESSSAFRCPMCHRMVPCTLVDFMVFCFSKDVKHVGGPGPLHGAMVAPRRHPTMSRHSKD